MHDTRSYAQIMQDMAMSAHVRLGFYSSSHPFALFQDSTILSNANGLVKYEFVSEQQAGKY